MAGGNEYLLSDSSNIVIGYSITETSIPMGSGILVQILMMHGLFRVDILGMVQNQHVAGMVMVMMCGMQLHMNGHK